MRVYARSPDGRRTLFFGQWLELYAIRGQRITAVAVAARGPLMARLALYGLLMERVHDLFRTPSADHTRKPAQRQFPLPRSKCLTREG
jgi:hypothetical protein